MKQGMVRQRHTHACPRLPDGAYAPHKCQGLWQYMVDLGKDSEGRRQQLSKSGFPTRRVAVAALQRTLDDIRGGVDVISQETVSEYLEEWLVSKRALRPTTVKSYREHIRLHIVPRIGHLPLRELRPRHVDLMITALARVRGPKALTSSTVRRIHATLRVALNDAVKRRLIPYNPATHVELPVARRSRTTVWDAKQVAAFLTATADDDLGLAFRLVVLTGLRRGELCGLRWSDLDLDHGLLWVRQAIADVNGALLVGEPKTKAGTRVVPLDETTSELLLEHRDAQSRRAQVRDDDYEDNDYVFARSDGTVLRPDTLGRSFRRAVKKSGLPTIRFHDLRHTSASLALAAGIPMRVVSDRLGHSSTAITADLYTHVVPSVAMGAAQAIADVVEAAGEKPSA
ncbi:site-specific integrase [Acidothermaceae bacterium B102]|nr:site-specific integrase [Acidothermaceae bacterium B102]